MYIYGMYTDWAQIAEKNLKNIKSTKKVMTFYSSL